jgi:hypothetical protein
MTTVWSMTGQRSAKAVCSSGSENAPTDPAKATATITFTTGIAGDTVTVGGLTFTCVASGATGQQWNVGGSDTANALACATVLNVYSDQTKVTASAAVAVVTLTANDYGAAWNTIPLSKTGDAVAVSHDALHGGVDIVGALLTDVGGFVVMAEAASGATITGGTLYCYILNGLSMVYARVPDLDLFPGATTLRSYGFPGSQVVVPRSRIVYVPQGVTISAGGMTVWINCTMPHGIPSYGGIV